MPNDPLAGTGRTTRQMQNAPTRAVFIVDSHVSIPFYKRMAARLGRSDLEIVSPSWLTCRFYSGRNLTGVVLDHQAAETMPHSALDALPFALAHVVQPS